jgi:hypothetical protein
MTHKSDESARCFLLMDEDFSCGLDSSPLWSSRDK